jgi:hypothetical protein
MHLPTVLEASVAPEVEPLCMCMLQVPYGQQQAQQQWAHTYQGSTPESYAQHTNATTPFAGYCNQRVEAFPGFQQPAAPIQQHAASAESCQLWPTHPTLHQPHLYSAQHPYPVPAQEPQQQIAAQQVKPVSPPRPTLLMERGGSSYALQLAFPRQEDVRPVTGPATVSSGDTCPPWPTGLSEYTRPLLWHSGG